MEPNGRYRLRIYDANGDYETPLALNPGLSEAITEAKLIYGMYGNRVQVVTLHDPIDDDIEVPDTVHFDTGPMETREYEFTATLRVRATTQEEATDNLFAALNYMLEIEEDNSDPDGAMVTEFWVRNCQED